MHGGGRCRFGETHLVGGLSSSDNILPLSEECASFGASVVQSEGRGSRRKPIRGVWEV